MTPAVSTRLRLTGLVILPLLPLAAAPAVAGEPESRAMAPSAAEAAFYVAPDGRDAWSGRRAAPAPAKDDGPFATVARARDAVRELRARGEPKGPVVVRISGGTYFLDEPLVFRSEDSGTADAPVIYAAYPGEKPVISGGRPVAGWTRETVGGRALWTAPLDWKPAGKDPEAPCRQFFVDDRRCPRPRLPKEGFYRMAEVPDTQGKTEWNKGQNRFRFAAGEIKAWKNIQDVEVIALHFWVDSRMPLASVDEQDRMATTSKKSVFRLTDDYQPRPPRYYVENVFEALGAPGEWYWDRAQKKITYWPRPGEDPAKARAVVPRLLSLMRLEGKPAESKFVEHVQFRGLTFSHALDFAPAPGWPSADVCGPFQAAFTCPGALAFAGARSCAVEDCAIVRVGGYGIELGEGCREIRIVGNEIGDLGGGGIKIGETALRGDEARRTERNRVTDNHIHDGGAIFHSAVGVWVGHSGRNLLAHNHVHHFYYSGFSVGWSWGYKPTGSTENEIAYNRVHDIGRGYLNDMGGIYTLGDAKGTTIHHNVFHDVQSNGYGGWGIYFDEGTTGIVAEHNVVYRTKSNCFHQHYGKENVVRNNIFALSQEAQIARSRAEPHLSFTFERNIVYWRGGKLMSGVWSGDNYKFDYNLYWHDAKGAAAAKPPTQEPYRFASWPFEAWQKKGQDAHSLIADPLFVDPDRGDFRLRPGSPASRIGFTPIDVSNVGPRSPKDRGR